MVFLIISLVILTVILIWVTKQKHFLFYFKKQSIFLGFLGVAVITMMDELTSVFYAPAEAYHFIGQKAMFYLFFASILIFLYSLTMTEIAYILELNKVKGGGVYSFSYLVFGKTISFIAAASILVDYVNTAAISSISALENISFLFQMSQPLKIGFELSIIWLIVLLNLLGAKENAKVTYGLFIVVAYIFTATIVLGVTNLNSNHFLTIANNFKQTISTDFFSGNMLTNIGLVSIGLGSTILAYSGIESVLQTHRLVENWKTIRKAYIVLGLTVGVCTPIIGTFALIYTQNPGQHIENLITYYASSIGGNLLAILMIFLATLTLAFAVNTAMVGAVEMIATMSDNYEARWVTKTNKCSSYHRIIIFMGVFFSLIILITQGNQTAVADMYAIGLIATFIINLVAILLYRYIRGFSDNKEYKTSLIKNIILLFLFLTTFIYLVSHKPTGGIMWGITVVFFIIFGYIITRIKDPEKEVKEKSDDEINIVEHLIKLDLINEEKKPFHIYFKRVPESIAEEKNAIYISFFLLRQKLPEKKTSRNHFILPINNIWGIQEGIESILSEIYEFLPDIQLHIHFGWSLSSWIEKISTGVVVYNTLKLPKKYPNWHFYIEYSPSDGKYIEKSKLFGKKDKEFFPL